MKRIDFSPERAEAIEAYESRGAGQVRLGDGEGEAHVYCLHFRAGGAIGPHPAGFGQLFLVVAGEGWVAGADGRRVPLARGQGMHIARGEVHAKGSEAGMTAIMVQVRDLEPAPAAEAREPRQAGGSAGGR